MVFMTRPVPIIDRNRREVDAIETVDNVPKPLACEVRGSLPGTKLPSFAQRTYRIIRLPHRGNLSFHSWLKFVII